MITAEQVMLLRKRTDMSIMECKAALIACNGDENAAVEWLRKQHRGLVERDKETKEGRIGVYISPDRRSGAICRLLCETAQVAKTDIFIDCANSYAQFMALAIDDVTDKFNEAQAKLKETIRLGGDQVLAGDVVEAYIHHDGRYGSLLAMAGSPTGDIGKHLAMHATSVPWKAVTIAGISPGEIEKVCEEARDQMAGKPPQVIEKILEGKKRAFYEEHVLVEQIHVRSDVYGKKRVKEVLSENGVTLIDVVSLRI